MENRTNSIPSNQSGTSFSPTSRPELAPAGNTSQDSINSVKETAGQTLDQVKESGKNQIEGQKDRAAETIGAVAQALRQTGWNLRSGDQAYVADIFDQVAVRFEEFSANLRDKDVNQLVSETESFARRQPALFLGGAFMMGLFAARFLKSSRESLTGSSGNLTHSTDRPPAMMTASRGTNWETGQPKTGPNQPDYTDWRRQNPILSQSDNNPSNQMGGAVSSPRNLTRP